MSRVGWWVRRLNAKRNITSIKCSVTFITFCTLLHAFNQKTLNRMQTYISPKTDEKSIPKVVAAILI